MLSRLIPKLKPSQVRTLLSSSSLSSSSQQHSNFSLLLRVRPLSTSNGNGNGDGHPSSSEVWSFTSETEGKLDSFFSDASEQTDTLADAATSAGKEDSWLEEEEEKADDAAGDVFGRNDDLERGGGGGDLGWLAADGFEKWTLDDDDQEREKKEGELFRIDDVALVDGADITGVREETESKKADDKLLEQEKKELSAVLKGPNRAFGDLIAASGITDAMLDSLFALKDFEGIEGLPPLREIEDMRYEKNTRKSARYELERQKQEEIAKARVRQVDDKGRAYGTGRRKCSIARVWVQPGDGKFVVNDKQFDVYFPMLDHRAALLQPFSETKTFGLWDINCTVKGGGVSGQVGAIQLGISRALQNWEPDLRPPLRNAGLLTRDPRVVERKKPGKAKARKSFQWVKR